MLNLTKIAAKTQSRVVLLGDKKSLLSLRAGSPFAQVLEHQVQCVSLKASYEPKRINNEEIIEFSLVGAIDKAFEKIGDRILAIAHDDPRFNQMASHYALSDKSVRYQTRLLLSSKAQCDDMNLRVRELLKEKGELDKHCITTTVLIPRYLSRAQAQMAKYYQVGQWLRFNEDYKSLAVKKGDYVQIEAIHAARNVVIFKNPKGQRISWDPELIAKSAGKVELFDEKIRELGTGDVLVWKRNHRQYQLTSGERLTVTQANEGSVTLKRDNNKVIKINLQDKSSHHFDYGYASTPFQHQAKAAENVIAYQNAYSRLSNQRSFYHILAQAKNPVFIYTENKEALLKTIQNQTANKVTAIETLLLSGGEGFKEISTHQPYLVMLEKAITKVIMSAKVEAKKEQDKSPEHIAKEAVTFAIAKCAEREAVFTHKELLVTALTHVLGGSNPDAVNAMVLKAVQDGELVSGIASYDGTNWTTKDAIKMERDILAIATRNVGNIHPIGTQTQLNIYLEGIVIKEEHRKALTQIITQQDRFLIIQGDAGTGKTTMLKTLEPFLKDTLETNLKKEGYDLLCLAPTHQAVKELQARGLTAQTLESFLTQHFRNGELSSDKAFANTVIAVDEASMISNRRMLNLMKTVEDYQTRLIIIRDKKQFAAIESGKPSIILEKAGVNTVTFHDIERQKVAHLLKAVKESYQGDFANAFETLKENIVEIGKETVNEHQFDNPLKRFHAICKNYVARDEVNRAKTLVLTFTNHERVILNDLIRKGLKEKGDLSQSDINMPVLVPCDMTRVEKARASSYRPGQVLKFNESVYIYRIKSGDYLEVMETFIEHNLLRLRKENGDVVIYKLNTNHKEGEPRIEIYEPDNRNLCQGDLIRWTRTIKSQQLISPELAKVIGVEGDKVIIKPATMTEQGYQLSDRTIILDAKNRLYQHWDHAYAVTNYSAQGKTVQEVLVNFNSNWEHVNTQMSFIVAITRETHALIIYTDDKTTLLEKIIANTGQKTSALETIGELKKSIFPTSSSDSNPNQDKYQPYSATGGTKTKIRDENRLDAQRIHQLLVEQTETIVTKLLGEPRERNAKQMSFGTRSGSLKVTLHGDKRGMWYDFQSGEGGTLVHLIAKEYHLSMPKDFSLVLKEAAKMVGLSEMAASERHATVKRPETTIPNNQELLKEEQQRLRYPKRLARESRILKNTVVEAYLRKTRGIDLEKFPETLRFLPGLRNKHETRPPAMLAIAKDEAGKVHFVQATYLDETTQNKADIKDVKKTFGLPSHGIPVDFTNKGTKPEITYVTEGIETGLSVFACMRNAQVKVTCGKTHFKNLRPETTAKTVVICMDNDAAASDADKPVHALAQNLLAHGKSVWIAKPETVKDYNDLLRTEGIAAVKANIEKAIPYENFRDNTKTDMTLKSQIFDQKQSELVALAKVNEQQERSMQDINRYKDVGIDRAHVLSTQANNVETSQKKDTLGHLTKTDDSQCHPEKSKEPEKQLDKEIEL